LKKAQKALPPFGWDTTPVLGKEEMIEEGFLEVFASLVYGSDWMDRAESTFRDCNWAMVGAIMARWGDTLFIYSLLGRIQGYADSKTSNTSIRRSQDIDDTFLV
jgi:hypothetical protein